jgi:predicted small lipoprotein YifL
MKRLVLISLTTLTLTACGYDGNFRYPCQDPANWETADCVPPICHASDYCTKDLVPDDALNS